MEQINEEVYCDEIRRLVCELMIKQIIVCVQCPAICKTDGVADAVKVSCEFVIPERWVHVVDQDRVIIRKI